MNLLSIFFYFCRQRLNYVGDSAGSASVAANDVTGALDLIYKGNACNSK